MNVELRNSPDVSGIQLTEQPLSVTAVPSRWVNVCVCANIYLLLISVFFVYSFLSETLPTLRGNPFGTTEDDDANKTYLPMSDGDGSETGSDVSSDDNSTE